MQKATSMVLDRRQDSTRRLCQSMIATLVQFSGASSDIVLFQFNRMVPTVRIELTTY